MEDKLILENINLVYYVLKKLNLYNQREDFFDLGVIGLIKGVKSFDHKKGFKLNTYLYTCIKNEILIYLRKKRIDCISLNEDIGDNLKLEDALQSNDNVERDVEINIKIKVLNEAVNNLSSDEKKLFNLFYRKKFTQRKIALLTNQSQANVCRKIKKLNDKLRKIIGGSEN